MLHASLDKWCKGRSVAEFEAIHKKLLAKIIELHGMSAAMFILSQGLQWMSQLPSAYHTTGDVLSDDDLTPEAHIKPLSLWHAALEKVHDLPDPWADRQLGRLPLQHGVRKRFNPVTREWLTDDVLLKMEPEPFARGSMRCCYRMKAFLTSFSRNWEKASNLVAKQYLSPNVESSEYYRDVQTQMQAKHYSEEYNRRNPPKKVDFIQCWVLELDDRPAPHHLFCVESMIQGKYTKYNSNAGFVADEFLRNTPQAFSHWTYEFSNGKEIVVDIQGVGDLYTDPQIHTRDHKGYGSGNTGLRGISLFFASHKCNPICAKLKLVPFQHMPEFGATMPKSPLGGSLDTPVCLPPAPPPQLLEVQLNAVPMVPTIYAQVHTALAEQHGRHMRNGDDTIAPGIAASSAAGIFHLNLSAAEGNAHAQLVLSLMYQHLRPKSAYAALMVHLQEKLPLDVHQGFKYTLLAAQRGVFGAKTATAHAYLHGIGVERSAVAAVLWYRQALEAAQAETFAGHEEELEAKRLPGGGAAPHEILAILGRLYQEGAVELVPDHGTAAKYFSAAADSAHDVGREDLALQYTQQSQKIHKSITFEDLCNEP